MKMIRATVISAAAQTPTQTRPVRVPRTRCRGGEEERSGFPCPADASLGGAGVASTGTTSGLGTGVELIPGWRRDMVHSAMVLSPVRWAATGRTSLVPDTM